MSGQNLYLPLADILSDAGLVVKVTSTNSGWERRARSSGGFPSMPLGVMWHHAASSPSTSDENCVNYQVRGNPDSPVGNFTLGKQGDAWPVAAGASNCSGKGGPWKLSRGTVPQDQGNTTLINIEVNNSGVGETWSTKLIDAYFAATLAINRYCGNAPDDAVSHAAYAPSRKIDPATASAVQGSWKPRSINSSQTWNLDDVTSELRRRATVTPPPDPTPDPTPTPPEEDDMPRFIYAFREYANTFADDGTHLSGEAYEAMVAAGAVVVTSELTYPMNQHLDSCLARAGLDNSYLVPK